MWHHTHASGDNAFAVYKVLGLLDKALAVDSEHGDAWQAKAQILGQILGRHAEAQACADRAIQGQHYNAHAWLFKGAHLVMAALEAGGRALRRERLEEAEGCLARALELGDARAARFLNICRQFQQYDREARRQA
jgi:tetratricopeptide (TPR) repeat protein